LALSNTLSRSVGLIPFKTSSFELLFFSFLSDSFRSQPRHLEHLKVSFLIVPPLIENSPVLEKILTRLFVDLRVLTCDDADADPPVRSPSEKSLFDLRCSSPCKSVLVSTSVVEGLSPVPPVSKRPLFALSLGKRHLFSFPGNPFCFVIFRPPEMSDDIIFPPPVFGEIERSPAFPSLNPISVQSLCLSPSPFPLLNCPRWSAFCSQWPSFTLPGFHFL